MFSSPPSKLQTSIFSGLSLSFRGHGKKGSVIREKESLGVAFIVTDLKSEITVHYNGVLPDLFREGKGVIAEGHLDNQNQFVATQILAKHDENYMPKNVSDALSQK